MTMRAMMMAVMMMTSVRAYALPVMLDFTATPYDAAYGQTSFSTTDDGVGVNVQTPTGLLWWDALDGFGIMNSGSYEADEIEGDEQLVVRFTEAVTVTGFSLTDLFLEHAIQRQTPCPLAGCYAEFGAAMFHYQDGTHSLWNVFQGVQTFGTNGVLDVAVQEANVVAMTFMAPGLITGDVLQDHEFSLSSITVDQKVVPEPGTLLLLVSGVGVIVARRRKV
jgi:hypothetical protein